jgi:hypothetical protein
MTTWSQARRREMSEAIVVKRSTAKILTTHVGSLPELASLDRSAPDYPQQLGADCGFGGRSHPQIAWAKLKSLVEGAERATKALRFA